jgi:hypothetical protein
MSASGEWVMCPRSLGNFRSLHKGVLVTDVSRNLVIEYSAAFDYEKHPENPLREWLSEGDHERFSKEHHPNNRPSSFENQNSKKIHHRYISDNVLILKIQT